MADDVDDFGVWPIMNPDDVPTAIARYVRVTAKSHKPIDGAKTKDALAQHYERIKADFQTLKALYFEAVAADGKIDADKARKLSRELFLLINAIQSLREFYFAVHANTADRDDLTAENYDILLYSPQELFAKLCEGRPEPPPPPDPPGFPFLLLLLIVVVLFLSFLAPIINEASKFMTSVAE